jgi:hypothetical protein
MKNKPFTYDSNGDMIWVQPLQAEKLPSANPSLSFVLRQEFPSIPTEELVTPRRKSTSKEKPTPKQKSKHAKGKDMEFVDTFKKLGMQQPSMYESMNMAPGVHLFERGRTKQGEGQQGSDAAPGDRMTRRQYENSVKSSAGGPSQFSQGGEAAVAAINVQPVQENVVEEPGAGIDTLAPLKMRSSQIGVQAANLVASGGVVPQPPSTPRPDSKQRVPPPPAARRVISKQSALGIFAMSPRERVPTGTGSRYPSCPPPPPLGATMGHGLIPQGSKYEEYYFPNSMPGLSSLGDAGELSAVPVSPSSVAGLSPRAPQGLIVNKEPELLRRLFNRVE